MTSIKEIINQINSNIAMVLSSSDQSDMKKVVDGLSALRPNLEYAEEIRQMYEGRGREYLAKALRARYPNTSADMAILPFNWVKLVASQDAATYDGPTERYAVGGDGVKIEEGPIAKEVSSVESDIAANWVLPEAERRVAVCGTQFIRVMYDAVEKRIRADLFWPQDVWVIPDTKAPAHLPSVQLLVCKILSPYGEGDGEEWYQVWSPNKQNDVVTSWKVVTAPAKGAYLSSEEYKSPILPWCVFNNTDGKTIYGGLDVDFVKTVEEVGVQIANHFYCIDVESHTPLVYEGTQNENASMAFGPGMIVKVGQNEDLRTLSLSPKLQEQQESIKMMLSILACTRRQSPDAYSFQRTDYASGVAKAIANEPQEKARQERVEIALRFERHRLWPALTAVHDAFKPNAQRLSGYSWFIEVSPTVRFEAPSDIRANADFGLQNGLISKKKAAVLLGFYNSEIDAESDIQEIAANQPDPPSTVGA